MHAAVLLLVIVSAVKCGHLCAGDRHSSTSKHNTDVSWVDAGCLCVRLADRQVTLTWSHCEIHMHSNGLRVVSWDQDLHTTRLPYSTLHNEDA